MAFRPYRRPGRAAQAGQPRYLRYPWYGEKGHRTIASLYLSLLHAVGEKRKNFGVADFGLGDLDQAGPLAEIMV